MKTHKQILRCCVHWEKTQVNTHTHTHIHTSGTHKSALHPLGKNTYLDIHTHSHLWYTQISTTSTGEKTPTWTYTRIHTYGTHKSALLPLGKKNLRGHTHIHTYGTHTSVCEPSETPTENSSAKTQRRRTTVVDLKALVE